MSAAPDAPERVPPANAPAVPYDPLREVRFAVVIYGGVSLAIYINGIVQEMLALVRATAPATTAPDNTAPLLPNPETQPGTEKVYRKLGQLLGVPDSNGNLTAVWQQIQAGAQLPIRTRFVMDVLSGTSAGGINAMFLAKALANNAPLRKLQTLWQEEGDIVKLINDKTSLEGGLRRQHPPQSLLNSQRMYKKLLDALDGMDADAAKGPQPSPLVDALDLFSTTTDIAGLNLPITLADRVVDERRHRNVFHFQYAARGLKPKNDFDFEVNPFLAYAARCTSAFPFAFEPMALCDIFPVLRTTPGHSSKPYCHPDTDRWQQYYMDYIGDPRSGQRHQPFQLRPFGDGGYLDNKPFSYAIDTLLKRHADLPVERKLVYIEPSPTVLRGDTFEEARPDAIENSLAALLTLPRYETIRQDLEAVVNRNVEVDRINRVVDDVVGSIAAGTSGDVPDEWLKKGSSQWGGGYITYERLKVTTVTDDLADLLSREFAIDARSALGAAVRTIARVWRGILYPNEEATRHFLLEFDIAYRLRRIRHVWRAINRLYSAPAIDAGFVADYRNELRRIKSGFEEPYLTLQDLLARAGLPPSMTSSVLLTEAAMKLVVEPPPLEDLPKWPGLERIPGFRECSERGAKIRARYILEECQRLEPLTVLATALRTRFETVSRHASKLSHEACAADPSLPVAVAQARRDVELAYKSFERYDSAVFPITFGTNVGECEPIDVHRISPDDAVETAERFDGLTKIRGQSLAAFGAFLDRDWRKNDILLGRFHGAERLISMLLPGRDAATTNIRKALIEEAHREIAGDFLQMTTAERTDWLTTTKTFLRTVKEQADPGVLARSATRASAVTGALLEGISDARHAPGQQGFRYVALVSRFLFQFVEVSVPHTLNELFGKYWLQLLALFALMLGVIAVFRKELWQVAAVVGAVVVVLFWARQLLRRYLRGQLLVSPVASMGITATLVVGLTMLVFLSPELTSPIQHAFDATRASAVAAWRARTPETDSASVQRFANAFLGAAFLVTVVAGAVLRGVAKRIPLPVGGAKHPVRRMQMARTRQDVIDAVGRYDLATRQGVVKAMRADFGFAAAYSMLFVAIGLFQAVHGNRLALMVGALGIAAGVFDLLENSAVIKALTPSSDDVPPTLTPSPRRFALAKWAFVAGATVAAIAFTVY